MMNTKAVQSSLRDMDFRFQKLPFMSTPPCLDGEARVEVAAEWAWAVEGTVALQQEKETGSVKLVKMYLLCFLLGFFLLKHVVVIFFTR
jgi:hypothetical protein